MSSLDRILPFLRPVEDLLVDPTITETRLIREAAERSAKSILDDLGAPGPGLDEEPHGGETALAASPCLWLGPTAESGSPGRADGPGSRRRATVR